MIYVNGKGPQIVMNSILIWFKKKTNPYGENRWSVYTLSAYRWVERGFFSLFGFFFPLQQICVYITSEILQTVERN